MSVTNRLVFDPAEASSHSNVGAYVRAGSDGDLIASQTIAAEEWLNVASALHDGSGTAISSTGGALDVNIASGAITLDWTFDYAEDAAHSSTDVGAYVLAVRQDTLAASTSADGDYASFKVDSVGSLYVKHSDDVNIADGGNSITVDAVQLDIDDLNATDDAVASWLHDGTGTAITSTGGALDINIASGFVDADDSLGNTAIANNTTAVSTTAVAVTGSVLSGRKWLYLANEGNKPLFYGVSGVTAANGFPLYPGQQAELRIGATPVVQIIGGTGASAEDLRVMQLS